MTRQKIHKKKPSNDIQSKIPLSSREQEIKQKTLDIYDDNSFELPPPKERRGILKEEMTSPSRHGSLDQNRKALIDSNISPPRDESVLYESKSPTRKGLIPKGVRKKSALHKKTPIPEQINKIHTIPRSTGVVHSKKTLSNTVNQPPPKIQEKSPKRSVIQYRNMGAQKERRSAINKPPPTKIHKKLPSKKKIIPPPIFDDIKTKIPKTKVKIKKPT